LFATQQGMVRMKTLMIVARDSMLTELEDLLHKNGITTYSVINKVEGSGKTGKVGAFHHGVYTGSTHFNLMILAVLPSDQVEKAVGALKAFHAARKKLAKEEPIPLKLFAFPCEELL
jgi:nitrogen regulatory protein PII